MAVRAPQQMSFGSADAHVTLPSPFLGGHSPLSARTAALQRKVTTAKAERLTCSEAFCSKCLPVLCCALPTLGLAGCATVPPRHTYAVFRFGKLDAVIDRPGLTWIYPFSDIVKCFTGARTQMVRTGAARRRRGAGRHGVAVLRGSHRSGAVQQRPSSQRCFAAGAIAAAYVHSACP